MTKVGRCPARSDPDRRGRDASLRHPARSGTRCSPSAPSASRFLAQGHDLRAYLYFLAGLCEAQHRVLDGLARAGPAARRRPWRGRMSTRMPPLDRRLLTPEPAFEATLRRLIMLRATIEMPDAARMALVASQAAAGPETRTALIRAVLGDAILDRGAGRACLCRGGPAGAFCAARRRPRRQASRPGRRRRLSRLRRSAGVVAGGRLAGRAWRALLRLLAVRHAVELCPHQMHGVRLDQGHRLSGDRRRRRHGQGRDLRRLPQLREDPAPAERPGARTGRRRCRDARRSTCWCARAGIGGPRSIPSCSAIERFGMTQENLFRRLPSVDEVLKTKAAASAVDRFGRSPVVNAVRAALDEVRAAVKVDRTADLHTALDAERVAASALAQLDRKARPSVRPVFNLTGTVLHTNLGRAPSPRRRSRRRSPPCARRSRSNSTSRPAGAASATS